MLIFYVRVKKNVRTNVGDVDAGAVPCGFGRAIGNKVCLSFRSLLVFLYENYLILIFRIISFL